MVAAETRCWASSCARSNFASAASPVLALATRSARASLVNLVSWRSRESCSFAGRYCWMVEKVGFERTQSAEKVSAQVSKFLSAANSAETLVASKASRRVGFIGGKRGDLAQPARKSKR